MTGSRETDRCVGSMCVLDTRLVARQEFPEEFVPTRGGEQAEGIQAEVFGPPNSDLQSEPLQPESLVFSLFPDLTSRQQDRVASEVLKSLAVAPYSETR
jgi:hypothetical protein